MEDQGKRLLIAVAIAFGLMLAWMVLFPPEQKPTPAPEKEAATESVEPKPTDGQAAEEMPAPVPPSAPEKRFTIKTDRVQAVFSSWGGTLVSWELVGADFDDPNKRGDQAVNLVPFGDALDRRWFATYFSGDERGALETGAWAVSKDPAAADVDDNTIEFVWQSDTMRVTKRFVIHPHTYLLETFISVERIGGDAKSTGLVVAMTGYQDPDADTGGGWGRLERIWKAACLEDEDVSRWSASSLADDAERLVGDIRWGGFAHSYFLAATAPAPEGAGSLSCEAWAVPGVEGLMQVALGFPEVKLEAGDPAKRYHLASYLGPKFLGELEDAGAVVGFEPGFGATVDLGFLSFIARPILWLLTAFQSVVVNWGLAIIVLTIVIKLATLHWTNKSMRSMREMAKLKPEIEKLQAKHKEDRQRFQQEMMALYKARGVSPLSGCLPMLLQMPIWFALYRALQMAAQLYQAPFIPGWIDDLTAPDPYYVLPVLTIIVMFAQSKLTPKTGDATQQKILTYGMPLMVGGMSFFFPAGLSLYIFISTGLSALHYAWMRHRDGGGKGGPGTSGKGTVTAPVAGEGDDSGPRSPRGQISGRNAGAGKSASPGAKKGPRPGAKKRSSKKKRGSRSH